MSSFDSIVIGAGHNGLACAFDLAKAGRKVLVLESAPRAGGAAVTREFATGFKVSACAHLLFAFPGQLMRDMQLERHGLRLAGRDLPTFALGDGGAVRRIDASQASGPGLSSADTAAYAALRQRLARYAQVVQSVLGMTPPQLTMDSWGDRIAMGKLALRLRMLGRQGMQELLRIAGMNVYDLLDDNLEDDLLKGAQAFDATLGADYGPRSPGTVLTWLTRLAGEQGAGGLQQPAGGMGALADAMVAALQSAGGELRLNQRVERVLVEDDKACGVRLASGETIAAKSVISSADPRSSFMRLVGPQYLDTGFVRRVDHHRARGLVAKLHLALSGLPRFNGLDPSALAGRIVHSPSMDFLELAFNPSKYREVPENPALEITLPTVNDPTLAPAGQHVMSVLVQFVPYDLGPDPDTARERLQRAVLTTLERLARGLGAMVAASEMLTPIDLEREFGLAGGHWHQGALDFDQFFINRPFPRAQQYRTPLGGFYLCGAGSHPGGGLMGHAGRNAAAQVLAGV
jgi:phytoene dehydrogenase-like protein